MELLSWGVPFALFSSTLPVVNKWILTLVAAPNILMAGQDLATCLFLYFLSAVQQKNLFIVFEKGTAFSSRKTLIWFGVCTLVRFLSIGSNMMALFHLGVDRVSLLRIVALFPIAIGDWLFNNRMLPSESAWICFGTLFGAAAFVFTNEHKDLEFLGLVWAVVYLVCITADQVLGKTFTTEVDMNTVDRVFWISALSVPVATLTGVFSSELRAISAYFATAPHQTTGTLVFLLSCVLGAGIAYAGWGFRAAKTVSAVTFSLVSVVCKLGSIALNFAFLTHANLLSITWICLAIVSTFFYEQAPKRGPGNQFEAHKTSTSKLAVCLLFVVFVGGAMLNKPSSVSVECPAVFNQTTVQTVVQTVFHNVNVIEKVETNVTVFVALPNTKPASQWGAQRPTPNPPKQYSWHRCVGRSAGEKPWRYKSCHFKNVCYDGNLAGQLTYFVDPLDQNLNASDLSSGTMAPYVASDPRSNVLEYKVRLVRNTAISTAATWPQNKVFVLANYFLPGVWTHLVFDNILPTFRLLEMFGLDPTHSDVAAHWLNYPCSNPAYHDGCDFSDRRYNPKWVGLMSLQKDFLFSKFQTAYNVSQPNLVCFSDVLTGLSLFSDHGEGWSDHGRHLETPVWTNFGTGGSLWNFREWTFERAKFHARLAGEPIYTGPFYDILFLRKGSRSHTPNALNTAPIADALRRTLPTSRFANATINAEVYLETLSLYQQMELLNHAKVVVSQVGSTAFGAFWLPPGSTLTLLHTGELLDFFLWDNIPWISVEFFAFGTQDEAVKRAVSSVLAGLAKFQHTAQ